MDVVTAAARSLLVPTTRDFYFVITFPSLLLLFVVPPHFATDDADETVWAGAGGTAMYSLYR